MQRAYRPKPKVGYFGSGLAAYWPQFPALKPAVRFGDMAPDEFGQAWTETGSTHHFALGTGHQLGKIQKLSKLLDVELATVTA